MALFHVPHIALGAELSDDFEERTSIVGVRQFLATFGGLLAIGIGFGVYFKSTAEFAQGQFNVAAYSPYALTLAMLMAVAMLACTGGTRSQVARLRQSDQAAAGSALLVIARMWRETIGALQNASFRWLFFGVLVVFLMVGADAALSLYMNTFFWELRSTDLILLQRGGAARNHDRRAVHATTEPALRQEARRCVGYLVLGDMPAGAGAVAVRRRISRKRHRRADVDAGRDQVPAGRRALHRRWSVSIRWSPTSRTRMNCATGKRQEGIFFAAVSFANKSTVGLGNILAGVALDVIHWPRGAHIQSAADIPAHTVNMLGILSGPIVAAFCVICVWCYGHYHLTRERHQEIQTALDARRQRAGSVA